MPRAVGEEAKEAKVKRRIRQKLHELGYDDATSSQMVRRVPCDEDGYERWFALR